MSVWVGGSVGVWEFGSVGVWEYGGMGVREWGRGVNPKFEIRNSKQIRIFKRGKFETFRISKFGLRICFGFRVSDFDFAL